VRSRVALNGAPVQHTRRSPEHHGPARRLAATTGSGASSAPRFYGRTAGAVFRVAGYRPPNRITSSRWRTEERTPGATCGHSASRITAAGPRRTRAQVGTHRTTRGT